MSADKRSLGSDTRGRVPFALVGVLLLVSSLVLSPTLAPEPAPTETAVERTLAELTASSQTAVRDGVATAARRSATAPVVRPADTPVGRALNESQSFRDALRLRIYLQTRDRLGRLSTSADGVEATASLPPVETTSDYRRAIEQVNIERTGQNETALQATVHNVTLTVQREDTVVTRRSISHVVVVATPVLHVHEQVTTYETRLNNGLTKPGLSQRLTARLYPIAWARGYAQFGRAPIQNVVANRHVSVATNGALLGVQRAVFGRSDPEGRQALTEATATVGLEDIVASQTNGAIASEILAQSSYRPASQNSTIASDNRTTPQPDEPMRIGLNETADAAFRSVAAPSALDSVASAAYSVDVRVVTDRTHLGGGLPARPDPPGEEWEFHDSQTTSSVESVREVAGSPSVSPEWHTLQSFGRVVEVEHRRSVTWTKTSRYYNTTVSTRTERFRVTGAIVGRHGNESVAPVRGIETAHDPRGSPVGGQNLADIQSRAETVLISDDGYDSIARAVARDEYQPPSRTLTGERPAALRSWLYRDLRQLHQTVRQLNTSTDRGAVGTFQTNPPRQLRQRLRQRRASLIATPDTYESVAHRTRVATRIAYLDAIDRRLTERMSQRASVRATVASTIDNRTGGSLAALRRGLTARETRVPRSRSVPTGPAGPVRTRVSTQPQYLTLASVDESQVPAVDGTETPLVARNINVFTVPYGNAASAVLDAAMGEASRVRLATAARTLSAANASDLPANDTLDSSRVTLQDAVARVNDAVASSLVQRVAATTDADRAASRAIVETALARWETTAARGMALTNDSAVDAVVSVTAQRQNLSSVDRHWLRLSLAQATTTTLGTTNAQVPAGPVRQTTSTVRSIARRRVQSDLTTRATQRLQDRVAKRFGRRVLPAGLPLAPPLTAWYATANIWWVTVEGEYARFSITASHGTPTTTSARMTYAREDEQVTVDVDDDGSTERLGHNTRLSFRSETGVVVVVPPKPRGVGDKGGKAVETSSGWPDPG